MAETTPRINSNQLIEDSEIVDVHVNKIINIAKVAKTNDYNDLDNIPEKFPPSEHTNMHPVVSETTDGMVSKEDSEILGDLTRFTKLRVIYNVEPQDVNKGYKSIDITFNFEDIFLNNGTMSELQVDTIQKLIRFIGSSLDPNIYRPIKGDKGDPGDKGESGNWWKPTVSDEGILTWELVKATEESPNGFTINIQGPDGEKGKKGFTGKLPYFENVLGNPLYEQSTTRLKGDILRFTNINDSNNINFFKNLTILDENQCVVFNRFQLNKYAQLYGNKFSLIYCVELERFYEWNDTSSSYTESPTARFDNYFRLNSFVYDTFHDHFLYINNSRRFIGA